VIVVGVRTEVFNTCVCLAEFRLSIRRFSFYHTRSEDGGLSPIRQTNVCPKKVPPMTEIRTGNVARRNRRFNPLDHFVPLTHTKTLFFRKTRFLMLSDELFFTHFKSHQHGSISMFSSIVTSDCNFYQYIFALDTIFTNQFFILAPLLSV